MPFLSTLRQRHRQPEIIDEPGLAPERLQEALSGLERINWWSGSAGILWPPIRALARRVHPPPLRILDIATGAGDIPIRLWHKARRAGLAVELAGCDRSPVAIAFARQRAQGAQAAVQFFECDAANDQLRGDFDVLTCSLFLHHLGEREAIQFLRRMAGVARRAILVNDLVRTRTGFVLAYLGTRVLSASPVVHTDGPLSVEGAFTIQEVRALAQEADLEGATVLPRWPCRLLLSWYRTFPNEVQPAA